MYNVYSDLKEYLVTSMILLLSLMKIAGLQRDLCCSLGLPWCLSILVCEIPWTLPGSSVHGVAKSMT